MVEIGAQGKHDAQSGCPCGLLQHSNEAPLVFRFGQGKQFFELVDEEQQLGCRWTGLKQLLGQRGKVATGVQPLGDGASAQPMVF